MKKLSLLLTFISFASVCHSQPFASKAYKTGIFVFCGKELPRTFTYKIERKSTSDAEWQQVAELKAPRNEADCKGSLLGLPASISALTKVEDAQVSFVWRKAKAALTLDSLYAYGVDPRYQYVAGCAYFDDGISKNDIYSYRISKIDRRGTATVVNEERVTFPSNSYKGSLQVARYLPAAKNIHIVYAVNDTVNTAGMKLLRSQHEQNDFNEVDANTLFKRQNNRIVAEVVDASIVQGVAYDYIAIPYDGLGNEGAMTDTLHIYNLTKPSEVGLIQKFDAVPKEDKRGIELSWKLNQNVYVVSIDIYRSETYNENYIKLASLPGKQTSYFDDVNITPAKNYFYYIMVNNGYGTNLPSARIPVILKGNKENLFPPQNLKATKRGNIVTLDFEKVEPDTRAYFVYRGIGYTGPMKRLRQMVISTDSVVSFIDTLPTTTQASIYSYAVADENMSYNISPLTDKVFIQTSGSNLPPPSSVEAMYRNNTIFVTWKDVSVINPAISSYKIFRTAFNADGKETEAAKVVATRPVNSFIDSNVEAGLKYHYRVVSVGLSDDEVSSPSLVSSITIPENLPMAPGQIVAFASDKKAVLKWDVPGDSTLKIRVYRSLAGEVPVMIKEINPPAQQYEDAGIETDKTYYYILTTVNIKNKESRPTEAVSVKVRG